MNRSTIAFLALMVTLACVLVGLFATTSQLPPRVASHFDGAGMPDRWMMRGAYLCTMAGVSVGLTAFLVGIFFCVRYFPTSAINLPQRGYWAEPERREETFAYLFRAGVWLAIFQAVFLFGIHLLVVSANALQPAKLSSSIWLLVGGFLLVTIVWSCFFVMHFRRVK
jgi:uncharacterized membrane protein